MSKQFEEWYKEYLRIKYENHFGSPSQPIEDVREAWDYQQQRIDDLVKQIETAYDHGYANGYTDGKQDAQGQE